MMLSDGGERQGERKRTTDGGRERQKDRENSKGEKMEMMPTHPIMEQANE